MQQTEKGIFGEDKSSTSARELLNKYISRWYIFLFSLLLCIAAAVFYIYYAAPKYVATSSILVKGDEEKNENDKATDLLENALKVTKPVNLSNEMLLLGSGSLMQRVVEKNKFNISYFVKGRMSKTEIYNSAPFTLNVLKAGDSTAFGVTLIQYDSTGGKGEYSSEKQSKIFSFKWRQPVAVDGRDLVFEPVMKLTKENGKYFVKWRPSADVAQELLDNMTLKPYDETTSVIVLTLKTGNADKGTDILNELFNEFYANDIEDRSKLSASTVQFIDDRLAAISNELKGVEGNIEEYQGSNQLADIKGQLSQSLENSSTVTKTIKDLAIQQGVVNMILNYFEKPSGDSKLVPSSLGLNDPTLASLIAQYNELQLKKEREAPLVAPNSTVMQDLNRQLQNLKSSILESLTSINKNLQLQESGFQQQSSQYKNFLSSVPHNERVLQEIKRKQSITEGLYLYLLQKREEAAISSTSSKVAHYKQIDPARNMGQIEPNKRNIMIYSVLLGLFLAFGIIHGAEMLNDKVKVKQDVMRQVSVPVVGEINHVPAGRKKVFEVLERGLVSEQFRSLRTSLSLLLKKEGAKTVLITSSVSGDGKSFVSCNLAAVCAIPGKKTALLEFDIRNPVINTNLHLNNGKAGLTDYLNGTINDPLKIMHVIDEIPDLHVYPCGSIPDNPADLLLSKKITELFDMLKSSYEYIIIDATPAGLVTDPVILAKHADIVLYVVRQQITKKKDLELIEELATGKTLHNMYIVLNDVKMNGKEKYKQYYGIA